MSGLGINPDLLFDQSTLGEYLEFSVQRRRREVATLDERVGCLRFVESYDDLPARRIAKDPKHQFRADRIGNRSRCHAVTKGLT